jgi:tRNA (adenine57-N1/adenine58-N1)-methyltransferase
VAAAIVSDERRAQLRDGDAILLMDRKRRTYMRTLRAGARLALRGRPIPCDSVIGLDEGVTITDDRGERFLVVRPTYAQLVPQLPRRAQPIYPKDVGLLLAWGDIGPGMHVIEIGVGAGALTLGLLRAVGPTGRLTSYEVRADFAEDARRNVARHHGDAPGWTVHVGDATAGLAERDVDRVTVDLAEPWTLLDQIAVSLRCGGVLSCFLPTILQVKSLVDALDAHPLFGMVTTLESLLREWDVKGRSIRPAHRMVAHTGLLVFARRLPAQHATELTPADPYSPEVAPDVATIESVLDDESGDSGTDLESD